MNNNRYQTEPIVISENNSPQPKGIIFNYTENFNRVI